MNASKENRNQKSKRKRVETKVEQPPLFLTDFIASKLKKYIEPQRQRTPRGETIGLSKKKYHASLLMLTNKRQKDIAGETKSSYGLVRKWNTEKDFKAAIEGHCREFAEIFIQNIQEANESREEKELQAWEKMSLDEFSKTEIEFIKTAIDGPKEFNESKDFSPMLKDAIREILKQKKRTLESENKTLEKHDNFASTIFLFGRLIALLERESKAEKEKTNKEREQIKKTIKDIIGDIKPFILQPAMTDEDKKIVLFFLKGIEHLVG